MTTTPAPIQETFTYSNYHLVSSTSIVFEIYEGEFKKCVKDTDEELVSKPFKLKLVYGKGQGEDKLLEYQILEGEFTDAEILEIIKSL
jgi:hypothetical protein